MKNAKKVIVGDILAFPACDTKAFFRVEEIINPMIMLVRASDTYGNELHFDLMYSNCHKASWFETWRYKLVDRFREKNT